MTARSCFYGKISRGVIGGAAAREILDALDETSSARGVAGVLEREGASAEARQAAADIVARYQQKARDQRADAQSAAIAQARGARVVSEYDQVVTGLRATGRAPVTLRKGLIPVRRLGGYFSTAYAAFASMMRRDPYEIATHGNVHYTAQEIRGLAHGRIAEVIDRLRPKKLGFDVEKASGVSLLRALYGDASDPAAARMAAAAGETFEYLRQLFVAAGGRIPFRKNWRLPNPTLDAAKVSAMGGRNMDGAPFKELVRAHVERSDMLDFDTGLPLSDARFEQLLDETWLGYKNNWEEGPPGAGFQGRKMLASQRDVARFFSWKSADSWAFIAENLGTHASPFETVMGHIDSMSTEIAMMRTFGSNHEGFKRFALSLLNREVGRLRVSAEKLGISEAKATKINKSIEAQIKADIHRFEAAWAEMTGLNDVPVHSPFANTMSDLRSLLIASQMGSAILSSLTDPGTVVMAARFNGIPAFAVLQRAVADMGRPGAEIFAAQQSLIADSIGHAIGGIDKAMGETIRTGLVARMGSAVIRASGLRRWTATLRNAFGLEFMAHTARERGKAFAALDADFRGALERYGIGSDDWDVIRNTPPAEPRPNALLTRPMDVADEAIRSKFARMINTEMDYAVIERDPVARAILIGASQPGTGWGEIRRGSGMYRSFVTSTVTMLMARSFARGFDGKRLTHGALTFVAMTALGVLAMQAKQIVAGRDPRNLDPTTADGLRGFGAAMLQGGGLGVFGDVFFVDQTRYGNSWAAQFAGPQFAAVETVVGDFVIKNLQKAAKGEEGNFIGDALFVAGRIMPGGNLWYSRLAFQRGVLDQLSLMLDPDAPARFRRMEDTAARDFGQGFYWRPGERTPARAPTLGGSP